MAVDVPQPAALAAFEAQRERREEQHAAGVAAREHLGSPLVGARVAWVGGSVAIVSVGEGSVDRTGPPRVAVFVHRRSHHQFPVLEP